MSAPISTFIASFTQEIARPSTFDVNIQVPVSLSSSSVSSATLSLRCENAQLPSRSFATIEQKFG